VKITFQDIDFKIFYDEQYPIKNFDLSIEDYRKLYRCIDNLSAASTLSDLDKSKSKDIICEQGNTYTMRVGTKYRLKFNINSSDNSCEIVTLVIKQ
jgi:plasmid maintenance system killer protein